MTASSVHHSRSHLRVSREGARRWLQHRRRRRRHQQQSQRTRQRATPDHTSYMGPTPREAPGMACSACYYLVISSTHLSNGHFRRVKGVFRGPLCPPTSSDSPVREQAGLDFPSKFVCVCACFQSIFTDRHLRKESISATILTFAQGNLFTGFQQSQSQR